MSFFISSVSKFFEVFNRFFINIRFMYSSFVLIIHFIFFFVIVGLFIVFIALDLYSILFFDISFADSCSAFSESLIRLYNFIWFCLIFVLTLVIFLLVRIIYLFLRQAKFLNKNFFGVFLLFDLRSFLIFGLLFNEMNFIKSTLLRVNEISTKDIFLNFWYSEFTFEEFLNLCDLSEYKRLELTWCAMPSGTLISLIIPSFTLIFSLDSYIDPELTVKVIGNQWYWSYEYDGYINVNVDSVLFTKTKLYELLFPYYEAKKHNAEIKGDLFISKEIELGQYVLDNLRHNRSIVNFSFEFDSVMINEEDLQEGAHRLLEVDNRVILPVGVPIRFIITSTDVLHSWSVPALGIKVDAVPGRLNQFVTEIKNPGVFYGQCSELCGPLHGFMPIVIQAVDSEEFEQWICEKILE